MKKTILFCGNGMSSEILSEIKRKYNILLISEFDNDIGNKFVDYYIKANSKDPDEALRAAKTMKEKGYNFDAVLSLCWDSAISVARIANYFNLFGISEEIAINSSDKAKRSLKFAEHNIDAPKYRVVRDEKELINAALEIGFPLVIKPLNLSSSKGVIKVELEEKLLEAYSYSSQFLDHNDRSIIVNEYIDGTEYSLEGLMIEGVLHKTGLSERVFNYSKYSPNFVEIGDVMPTNLNDSVIERFSKVVENAAKVLNIMNGVVKADLILNKENEVKIFEITPRLGGPRFGTEMIPLHNGTNILEAAIQQALGEKINMDYLTPKFSRGVVNRSIFPDEGIITNITGLEEIRHLLGFYDFKWWSISPLKVGDKISKPEYGCGEAGYIIVTGKNRNEALENADRIENAIKIITRKVGN